MVLNLGSTSFKFKYYPNGTNESEAASGYYESIGSQNGEYSIKIGDEIIHGDIICNNHREAIEDAVNRLAKENILSGMEGLDAIGYKAVHAGDLKGARKVNESLLRVMERYLSFAPAHNACYISMMKQMMQAYSEVLQIAYFETSFHSSIPEKRAIYGIPYEWKEKYGIRRYGFHGSSHSYIAARVKELNPLANKIISLHLGGSSSICAIKSGKSVACSMGATPQSGLFQNNRVGDFDAFCLPELVKQMDGGLEEVMGVLATKSGFLGISGVSNDFREILKAKDNNNKRAMLAVASFVDNIIGYIGMFAAYLKGVDTLVFTGGIGLRSSELRNMVCKELEHMGIMLDNDVNLTGKEGKISTDESKVSVYVLNTNEELMVARKCEEYIKSLNR
jgi:acetate kinase